MTFFSISVSFPGIRPGSDRLPGYTFLPALQPEKRRSVARHHPIELTGIHEMNGPPTAARQWAPLARNEPIG
jgi:hypothetical protein